MPSKLAFLIIELEKLQINFTPKTLYSLIMSVATAFKVLQS